MTRDKIISVARNYIGVPYQTCGFSPIFGLGCWGFFVRVCHDLGLHAPKISDKILKARHEVLIRAVYGAIRGMKFEEVDYFKFGDIAIKISGSLKGHIGFITENKIIHATKKGIQETKIEGQWTGFEFPGVK